MATGCFMGAARAVGVVQAIEQSGAKVWIDGGWGVDAVLGDEVRVHSDLDLVVELSALSTVVEALGRLGYTVKEDHRPTRLVLGEPRLGTQVDLHPVVFQAGGGARQLGAGAGGGDAVYPAEGFSRGRIRGRDVGCLRAPLLVAHHTGYRPDAVDVADVARLCRRFALPWPEGYPELVPLEEESEGPIGGRVVRSGASARRPIGPWSPAVHELLGRLRSRGFQAGPEVRGVDEQGREVLSWLEGASGWLADGSEHGRPHPALLRPGALVEVGRLLQGLHEAAGDGGEIDWSSPRPMGSPRPGPGEAVVGHNDLAPWNLVVGGKALGGGAAAGGALGGALGGGAAAGGAVAGLIDWDLAGPTSALWDLAGAAWRLAPLYSGPVPWSPDEPVEVRVRQLADGYGLDAAARRRLVPTILERMESHSATVRTWGGEGIEPWAGLLATGHDRVTEDLEMVAAAETRLTAALLD